MQHSPQEPELGKVDITGLEGVIISHAHFDHYGSLPTLMNLGYEGSIFTSKLTSEIFLTWVENKKGIFGQKFGEWFCDHLQPINYFEEIQSNNYSFELIPSSHSFDSSMTLISNGSQNILYTGDLGTGDENIQIVNEIDAVIFDGTNLFLESIDDPNVLLLELAKTIRSILISGMNVVIRTFPVPGLQLIESIQNWVRSGYIPTKPNFYIDQEIELVKFLQNFSLSEVMSVVRRRNDLIEPFIFITSKNAKSIGNSVEIQPFKGETKVHVRKLVSIYGSIEDIPWQEYNSEPIYLPISNHFPRNRLPELMNGLKARLAIPVGNYYGKEEALSQWWKEYIPNTKLIFFHQPERKLTL